MRECVEKLFVSVSYLFSSLVNILTEADSLQLSYESDGDEYRDTDRRDQTRDDFSHCSTSKSECIDEEFTLTSPEDRRRIVSHLSSSSYLSLTFYTTLCTLIHGSFRFFR